MVFSPGTIGAMRTGTVVIVMAAAIALPLAGCARQGAAGEWGHYSVDWIVSGTTDAERTYTVEVVVVDLTTGDVVSKPKLYARWGEPAEITQSSPDEDLELTARVFVDEAGTRAEYGLEMTKAGRTLLSDTARIDLSGVISAGSAESPARAAFRTPGHAVGHP